MNWGTVIRTVFSKYATFKGVAPRSEYWLWVLFTFAVTQGLNILGSIVSPDSLHPNGAGVAVDGLRVLFSLGVLLPSLAVLVRRFHDAGFSGKWLFLWVLPFVLLVASIPALIVAYQAATDMTAFVLGMLGSLGFSFLAFAAVGIFQFVIILLPSKTAANGNKHAV